MNFFVRLAALCVSLVVAVPLGRAAPSYPPADTRPLSVEARKAGDKSAAPQRTIADCMATWDRGTHMSKAQWQKACKRAMAME